MSITVTSGCDTIPQCPSPWDAAGVMSTYYPQYTKLFEWIAVPRWHIKYNQIYVESSAATTIYLPPVPAGSPRHLMVTDTSKISGCSCLYPYSGGTYSATAVTPSTSWSTWPHYLSGSAGRWNALRLQLRAAADWGTKTGLTVSVRSSEQSTISSGYGRTVYAGTTTSPVTVGEMAPCIPMSTPTGLSSAHYNALVRQVRRSLVCPVLHAGYIGGMTSHIVQDVFQRRIFPVAILRDAPQEQKMVSLVVLTSANQESETGKIIVWRGDRSVTADVVWHVGSFIEWRWDMSPLMGEPDLVEVNTCRDIYYISFETTVKSTLLSCSLWGGLYDPA